MIHYSTVLDIRRFKDGPKKCCIQTKIYRLYRKMTIYSHFHTLPHDSCGVSWYHISCPPGVHLSIFLFPDDNSSKYQWIFTKLGMFFDILDTWLWIANGQISSVLTELSACDTSIFIAPACGRVRYRRPIFRLSVRPSVRQHLCRRSTFMSKLVF